MTHATRTKRFWRRSLVWVIPTIIVLLIAWVAWEVRMQNERTQSLMRYAVSVGGQVYTDIEVPAWLEAVEAGLNFLPVGFQQWVSKAQVEFFEMPVGIVLEDSSIDDAGLAHLRAVTRIEYLDLSGTPLSDAGLAYLSGLTNLEWLDLWGTQVSDTGLHHLAGLSNLKWLSLTGTQVTDAGVNDLRQALPDAVIIYSRPVASKQ